MIKRSIRTRLYEIPAIRWLKDRIRPFKHSIFGKDGIYKAIDEVARMSGGREKVRTILDIGAASGDYAIHFLRAFPQATVYCFEPQPGSFRDLERCTRSFSSRVRLFNFGLYRTTEKADFYVSSYRDASSLVHLTEVNQQKITVQLRRLDEVLQELGLKEVDFAKIDVEGAELGVLQGGPESFTKVIRSTYIEIQPACFGYYKRNHIEIFDILQTSGFGYAGVYGDDYFFSKALPEVDPVR